MRQFNNQFLTSMLSPTREARFTVRIDFTSDLLDPVYILSHADSAAPAAADILSNSLISGSAISQTLKNIAGIGGVTLTFQDNSSELSNKLKEKLDEGRGVRLKRIRIYAGFKGVGWNDYEPYATSSIGNLSFKDKKYSVTSSDVQRIPKDKKLFPENYSNLFATVSESETVRIRVFNNSKYSLVEHGSSYTDSPNREVFYVEIDDEVIRCKGAGSDGTSDYLLIDDLGVGNGRGVFKTVAIAHEYDTSVQVNRQLKVTEYVYLEMPVIKLIYAALLGALYGQVNKALPQDWSANIDASLVQTSDFTNIGDDLWDVNDDEVGIPCRFLGLKNISAKEFIEEMLLPMVGCFMPVYADGSFGLKRRDAILELSSTDGIINKDNAISHGALTYDTNIANKFKVRWNWSDLLEDYQLTTNLQYADSIGINTATDYKVVEMRGAYANKFTDETIANIVDLWASRNVFPQFKLPAKLMPSALAFEVGDVPQVTFDTLTDFTANNAGLTPPNQLSRPMEITRTSLDLLSGETSISLQASSGKITPYADYTSNFVLPDAYYDGSGKGWTRLTDAFGAAMVNGVLESNATLTGGTTTNVNFYHLGDFTVDAGVTLTLTDNVTLWVRGTRTNNGTISGVGGNSDTPDIPSYGQGDYLRNLKTWGMTASGSGFTYLKSSGYVSWKATSFTMAPGGYGFGQRNANFIIRYENGELTGLPTETRGTNGTAGSGIRTFGVNRALGGAPGAGGAGFTEIARGFVDDIASSINLSGGNGSKGENYALTYNGRTTVFAAGGGAQGAPGILVQLIDGSALLTPDKSTVTLNYGVFNTDATDYYGNNSDKISTGDNGKMLVLDGAPSPISVLEYESVELSNKPLLDSHLVVKYLKDDTPRTELPNEYAPKAPVSFAAITSGTADLFKQADGTIVSRINVNWNPSTDPLVSNYEIYYRLTSSNQFIKISDEPKRGETQAYIPFVTDGANYTIQVRAKNVYGYNSSAIETTHTVVGKDASPNPPISPVLASIAGGIEISWTNPADTDLKTISIFTDPASAPTDPADLWDQVTAGGAGSIQRYILQLPSSSTRFIRLKTTDTTGNSSALVATVPASETSQPLPTGGVADSIVNQGDLATLNSVAWDSANLSGIPDAEIYNIDDATALGLNGGFNEWADGQDLPANWGGISGSAPIREAAIKISGNYSVKYITNGADDRYFSATKAQEFLQNPLPSGSFFIFSFSYYFEAISGGGRPLILVDLFYNASSSRRTIIITDDISLNAWHRQQAIARVNSGEVITGYNILVMGSWNGAPGGASNCTVYFDNVGFNIMRAEALAFDDGVRIEDLRPAQIGADSTVNSPQSMSWVTDAGALATKNTADFTADISGVKPPANATANSSDATLLNVDNHTEGSTNRLYKAAEKTKLGTISTNADVTGSNLAYDTARVGGTLSAVITQNVLNFNSSNDRNGNNIAAPSILANGNAIDHTINSDGSCDISFEWGWSGSNGDIDGFLIYIRSSSSSAAYIIGSAPVEETSYAVVAAKRVIIFQGLPSDKNYTFGIQAYRSVDPVIFNTGVIVSSIVQPSFSNENPYLPSSVVAFSGNIIGTIDGEAAATVRTNAADGSTFTNLSDIDYNKVVGTKPPPNATVNSSDATLLNVDNHTDGTTNKLYKATEQAKLGTIESSATANSSDATLLNVDNHTEGSTNRLYKATEQTKLGGIQNSATANSLDAVLLNVDNHTDGSTNKLYKATEQTKLGTISTNADVTGVSTALNIIGQGLLATQNTADYTADISGAKPPANATVNSPDATLLNVDNHTDGTTNKLFLAGEKTKLGTVAANADVTGVSTALNIVNQGDLATQNTADYTNDISGAKPPTNADNTQSTINAGINTTGTITNGTKIDLDFNNGEVNINGNTFGSLGIQSQYNNGAPRLYVGDGSNQFMRYDSSGFSLGKETKLFGADAFNNESIYWHSFFDSADGFSLITFSGSFEWLDGAFYIKPGSAANNSAEISRPAGNAVLNQFTFAKRSRFKTGVIFFDSLSNRELRIGVGDPISGGYFFISNTPVNGNIWALTKSSYGVEVKVDTGVLWDENNVQVLMAEHSPSQNVTFYIDGTQRAQITNRPSQSPVNSRRYCYIKYSVLTGGQAGVGEIEMTEFIFNQD